MFVVCRKCDAKSPYCNVVATRSYSYIITYKDTYDTRVLWSDGI